MNVLVIAEDFTKDQHMLKPIVGAMMAAAGRRNARVTICKDPRLGSVEQALQWSQISRIIDRYRGMIQLFLLCVDRDCRKGRRTQLNRLEQYAARALGPGKLFLAENAWQEIEVWVLAGHDLPNDWSWQTVREEVNPKEIYFEPFARERGVVNQISGGRQALAEAAAQRYSRIRQLCPEDVGNLENRIRVWIETA